MFFFCRQCDCEVAKQPKEQIDVSATLDEGISPRDLMGQQNSARVVISARGDKTSAVEAVNAFKEQQAPGEDRPLTPSTADGSQTQRSETSMGEETRRAEKERLNSMVKIFSRQAISGLDCKMLQNSDYYLVHEYAACKFFLDTALSKVTLDDGTKKVVVPFLDIVEVCAYEDLMELVPDSQIAKKLREENRKKAVFVQHQAESWLCLVVEDEADVERFVACLKILQLYSRSKDGHYQQKV